jgi:ribosome biogenesis protein BRX1
LDVKGSLAVVNEIAEAKSCNTAVFFEVRKKRDLYLWVAATPAGPSVKFHVVNVHTMDELRLTGNCLKGARPLLSFDAAFEDEGRAPHLRLVRELLAQTFATPAGHPKSQPFHDHVIHFGYADGKVWFRHFQVVDKAADAKAVAKLAAAGEASTVLVEIGPRFVLDVVRIFGGSMGGPTLWTNPAYTAPNAARRQLHLAKANKYAARVVERAEREARAAELVLPRNPVDAVFDS